MKNEEASLAINELIKNVKEVTLNYNSIYIIRKGNKIDK